MTKTEQTSTIDPQALLDQILKAGRDLAARGQAQSGDLSAKGKAIAAKGEDILVDKLGLEDTEVARDALRKGVGTGAAAGALALLLSSRSGRKMATLGGLAGLGVLAYRAHKSGKMPSSTEDVIGLLKGEPAANRANILLSAMVAAAKADGEIHDDEMGLIKAHDAASVAGLEAALSTPSDPKAIAALSDSEQASCEIYAVSCRIANGLNPDERDYLDQLAMALRLDPTLAADIETQMRTG